MSIQDKPDYLPDDLFSFAGQGQSKELLIAKLASIKNEVQLQHENSALRQRIAALEAEKAEREAQGAGADFVGWLGPRGIFMEDEIYQAWKECRKDPSAAQYRKVYAAPPIPRVDPEWLANVIRTVAPHLCAERDELAEKIADAINGRSVK